MTALDRTDATHPKLTADIGWQLALTPCRRRGAAGADPTTPARTRADGRGGLLAGHAAAAQSQTTGASPAGRLPAPWVAGDGVSRREHAPPTTVHVARPEAAPTTGAPAPRVAAARHNRRARSPSTRATWARGRGGDVSLARLRWSAFPIAPVGYSRKRFAKCRVAGPAARGLVPGRRSGGLPRVRRPRWRLRPDAGAARALQIRGSSAPGRPRPVDAPRVMLAPPGRLPREPGRRERRRTLLGVLLAPRAAPRRTRRRRTRSVGAPGHASVTAATVRLALNLSQSILSCCLAFCPRPRPAQSRVAADGRRRRGRRAAASVAIDGAAVLGALGPGAWALGREGAGAGGRRPRPELAAPCASPPASRLRCRRPRPASYPFPVQRAAHSPRRGCMTNSPAFSAGFRVLVAGQPGAALRTMLSTRRAVSGRHDCRHPVCGMGIRSSRSGARGVREGCQ